MKVDVLLGLQWGDEGKGKIVDVLTPHYDVIARFQGGPNAGHTLEFNGQKHVLHLIPSGIFHQDKINIIGNGVVMDPLIFKDEIDHLKEYAPHVFEKLYISQKAHFILPTHKLLDKANEIAKGNDKIGSTLKGIGPAYTDKSARVGIRVGDVLLLDFKQKVEKAINAHNQMLKYYGIDAPSQEDIQKWLDAAEFLKKFRLIHSEYEINNLLKQGKKILAEGAQGTMLDIDFGTYPFVTSSNTVCAGACTGLGIAPNQIGKVIGIFKAYTTRVGSGPFPTELNDEVGEEMRKVGHEFGSTTGRARRCGWLDMIVLKYAVIINGVTELIMMKSDVLNDFEQIKVGESYQLKDGSVTHELPYDLEYSEKALYKVFPGWKKDLCKINDFKQLPSEFMAYIDFIEKETEIKVSLISTGPDRKAVIFK